MAARRGASRHRGTSRRPAGERGFVLLAVMILIGAALLLAGSLIHLVRAEAAGAGASVHGEQSRGLAWSGLQAVMADLDEQRRGILSGDLPRLEAQYTIYEDGEFLGVVRLLPVGPRGDLLEPEAGKLDLNVVDAAALERTLLIDPALAAAIIAHRDSTLRRPFQSVAELLDVPGMTPQVLYGAGLGAFSASGAEPFIDGASVEGGSMALDSAGAGSAVIGAEGTARSLADVVTVFAVEPSLQLNGRKRINLNTPWSDELRRRLTDRFGEGIANAVKSIFDQGTTFESDAKIVQILRFFNVPPRDWREALDVFSTEESDYRRGRLDLNTASYEALLGLEGLTPDQAAEIARAQADLSAEERATVAWPAMREILTPEQFEKIVGRVTTRSFTYRLRLAAGTVDAIEPDAPLRDPVIYEVVIDLASPRARVAYMRDVTMVPTVVEIAGAVPQGGQTDDSEEDEGIEKEGLKTADNEGVGLDDLDLDTELDLGGSTAMGGSDRSSSGGAMGGGGAAGGGQPPKPGGAPPRIGRWKSGGGGVGSGSGA
ncbi:MAG: helix-hairpin-helix domain-containing protein [Phycisphaerales bacterium]|nr:helix-hairpin-helix domain-containing protein [Phycisphaerales bacterium]